MMKFLAVILVLCLAGRSSGFVPSDRRLTGAWIYSGLESHLMSAPDPLASEGDWTAFLDEDTTGLVYYFNGRTGESRWEPPTSTFPTVTLKRSVKRKADAKREEYKKSVNEQPKEQKRGFLSTLLEEPVEKQKQEKPKEEEDWFSSLWEDKEEPTSVAVEEPKQLKPKEQEDWFGFLSKDKKEEQTAEKTATVEEIPTEIEATETKEKVSFFDKILKNRRAAAGEQQVVEPVEKVPEEIMVPEKETPIQIEMASYVLPHPAKIFWGGEDAVFTADRTFGVFDGVSGATKLDGIPLYSKTLAKEMKRVVGDRHLNIREITNELTRVAEFADKSATGASTALVASIGEDGFLRALNLGDSTCMVIRNNKVVGKTREISHYFDCPYQLSTDSPDRPMDGTKLNMELIRGDLILMGSDGIFDNLTDQEIVDIVSTSPDRSQVIAKRISDQSRKQSQNPSAETPYAQFAKRNGDPDFANGLGGKLDDVSCVVVRYN